MLYAHLSETGKPLDEATVQQLIYLRGYRDREFFANYFFSERCEHDFSKMHQDFFEAERYPERRGVKEAIAAPRGHAKTTFKLLIKVVHAICYHLEPFILIIGHTTQDAEERVGQILEVLETNHRLKAVFGPLLPETNKRRLRSRKRFETASGILVLGKSKGQSLRGLNHQGQRPSLIILDDVESMDEVRNPEQRRKTREWFFKDIMKLGKLQGQTNITLIGTCLHPEALLPELLENPAWQTSRYQAVISFATNQALWQQYRDLLTDLSCSNRVEQAYAFYKHHEAQMLEGVEVLWPEGEPYEYLMRIRIEEGEAAFNSEKQNEPFDPERNLFNMQQARFFKVLWQGQSIQALQWLDQDKKVPGEGLERIIAYHDPALGQKPAQGGDPDYAAIVVVGQDHEGYLYVLDVYLEKDTPDRQVRRALSLYEKWGFSKLYYENNGSQALMGQIYRDFFERLPEVPGFQVQGVHQSEDKFERISTLEPEVTNGYLRFSTDLSPRFMDQMTYFPMGSHDDGPDALHGAVRQLKRRLGRVTQVVYPQVPY